MVADDFPTQFADTLRAAGQTLEEHGYDVVAYGASISDTQDIQHTDFADTPEEALDAALDATSEDRLQVYVDGSTLQNAVQGEDDWDDVVYQTVRGQIEIDEPMLDQPDWADEPLDEPVHAFGTVIRYVPDNDDGYFEVGNEDVQPPYTQDEANERVDTIIDTLQEAGFEARRYN